MNAKLMGTALVAAVVFQVFGGLDRTRFNIGAYRFGDRIPGFRTEQHVKELKEAGVDFVASMRPGADAEAFYRTMDLFEKYGIGAITEGGDDIGAGCPAKAYGRAKDGRPLDPAVYLDAANRFRPHAAIWGLDVGDEPHGMDWPNVGKAVELCRRHFPEAFLYVNLFPSYARVATNTVDIINSQLGSPTYRDYVEDYCRHVPLDYISFDIYPYSQLRPRGIVNFLANLQIVADACARHGKDLWLVGQANTWFDRPPLAANKMRYQAYAGLAFGAEAMTWACWTKGWWTNNVYSATGEKTVAYDRVKAVNAELHRLGDACLKYRRVATHFVGYTGAHAGFLDGCKAMSETSVSTGWVRDVAAADGEPLLVAEMVPRDARASGAQAIFVMASEDPYDENEKERVIRFRPLCRTVEALGGEGPLHVARDAEGFSTITLRSSRGALVWTR